MRDDEDGAGGLDYGVMGQSLGFLLRLAQLAAFRDFYVALGDHGVRPGEVSVLILIGRNPGIRQGHLARQLMIKRAHMTKMVQAMEDAGLVRRTVPDDDRRSVELWLTPAGQRRAADLAPLLAGHEAQSATRLTKREEEQLKRLLKKFLRHPDGD